MGFNPIVYNVEERQGFVDLIIETNNDVRLRDGGVLFFTNDGSAVSSGGMMVMICTIITILMVHVGCGIVVTSSNTKIVTVMIHLIILILPFTHS